MPEMVVINNKVEELLSGRVVYLNNDNNGVNGNINLNNNGRSVGIASYYARVFIFLIDYLFYFNGKFNLLV